LMRNPQLSRLFGERNRRLVRQRFTAEHMVNRMVSLYDQLLSAKEGDRAR